MSRSTGKFALVSLVLCMLFGAPFLLAEEKPAASVVIPYFEVSPSGAGKTTLFSLSNAGAAPAIARVTLWTSYWQPTLAFDVVLAAHDIATYNVRDLLNGTLPGTDPLGQTGCVQYPSPAFGEPQRQTLWQDHQGQTCLAADSGGLAVGIITIDVVRQCTPLATSAYAGGSASTPLAAGYFVNNGAGLALNSNVLLSDFHLVDPQENYAQGETAYHLTASSSAHPAGGSTFYSALGSLGTDNRAPLPAVLYGRFLDGGAFTGGTELILLRQPQRLVAWTEIDCGSSPWTEAENRLDMMVLDEGAKAFLSQRPILAGTQKVNVRSWEELPNFGALTLRSADDAPMAGMVLHNASSRFGTGFKLQSLGGDAGDGGIDTMANSFRVDFTYEVNAGLVSFDGGCFLAGVPSGDCTAVAWYFGDGTSASSGLETSHTYAQDGTYPVTLVARNGLGQQAAATRFIVIDGAGGGGGGGGGDFTVAFVALQIPGTLSVGFQGSCFLNGSPVACEDPRWTFGDGAASTMISPSHLYGAPGTYPVTFTASHDQLIGSASANVLVESVGTGPGPTFEVSFTTLQIPGTLAVQFVGTCFSDAQIVPCGNPQWTFGDGGAGSSATVQHTYAAAGTYPVSFTATHQDQTDTATANVVVQAVVPGDSFEVSFTALQVPGTLGVQLVGTCFANTLPVTCGTPQWTFGDGGTGNTAAVLHTYPAAGTYTVTFTASHNGDTDSATSAVQVTAVVPNTFEVHFTAAQIPETLDVQLVGACFAGGLTVACGNPQWTFGDGGTGNTAAVQHTYASAGTYTVTFTASHNGQTDSVTGELEVVPITPPEITFEVLFGSTQTPNTLEVLFTGTCRADGVAVPCGNPQWIFGDGGAGSGASVSHTYGAAGNFTVTFTASHNGQTDSHSQVVVVAPVIPPPNNPPTITSLICTPNPVLGGLISLCVLVVADLDGDNLDFEIDVVGGVGICLQLGESCTTSILGNVTGGIGIPIPFAVATNLLTQTTATIEAIITDSHGASSLPITTTLEVLLNTPPVVSVFVCVPPVVVGGLSALCSFNLVDLNPGNLGWKVEVVSGSNVCLGEGPGCNQTLDGATNGLLTTINFLMRTSPSSSSSIRLRATADDGLQTHAVDITVLVL